MKRRPHIVKWQEFQKHNKHRQLAQLDKMIDEFEQMISDLEQQMAKAPAHFSATTMVQAARQRRDNLIASVANLKNQREAALLELEQFPSSIKINQTNYDLAYAPDYHQTIAG